MSFRRSTMLHALAWLEHGWDLGLKCAQRVRRQILIGAAVVIVAGLVLTIKAHPEILDNISWNSVALLVCLITPVLILLGAMEFVVMAACLSTPVPLIRALFVTVIGSAVNFLPVPGAMMTRIAALKAAGASARNGARLSLLQGLLWLAMTMMLGGGAIVISGHQIPGAGVVVAGLLLAAAVVIAIGVLGSRRLSIAKLVVIRFVAVFFDGVRVAVALAAIGTDIPLYQAMIFTLASSFGSALSIIPVGLGIRELISAALAPIIGIPIALGFAAAVLIRLVDLFAVFILAIALAIKEKRLYGGL